MVDCGILLKDVIEESVIHGFILSQTPPVIAAHL